jgi:hypothetical protein
MDGFPNGRRLEDDVTTIELQAVSGVALAAIGLWYDDYIPNSTPSPLTPDFLNVFTFTAGVTQNDTALKTCFPYEQIPWRGFTGTEYTGPSARPMAKLQQFLLKIIHSNNVQLQWQVEDNVNVSRYEVERSTDMKNYIKIGEVRGNSQFAEYTYNDMSPVLDRINYYRIKAVDNDGKSIYTPVRFAKFDAMVLTVSPNPATSYITINSTIQNVQISIFDAYGRKMLTQRLIGSSKQVPVASWTKGIYTIIAEDKGLRIDSKKIVIQ